MIVGPNTTPNALALLDVIAEGETPMVALAASASIVSPPDSRRAWTFKIPQNDTHMATILTQYMADNHIRTVAIIGFADADGDSWWCEFSRLATVQYCCIRSQDR